ncbi:MAG: hypothetical protein ACKOZY_02610, partial [Flavobacteriales bacterium]
MRNPRSYGCGLLTIALLLFGNPMAWAQVVDTARVHFFGGLESDQARRLIRTADGGFLLMGTT